MVGVAFFKVLQLFFLILSGYLLKVSGLFSEDDARKIIRLNTYTFLPALIFYVIYSSDFSREYLLVPMVGFFLMLVMTAISYFFGLAMGIREKKYLMPFVVASSAGNTGYIGYPVCLALYGNKGLTLAVTFDIFATVFYALVIAAFLISYGAQKTENILKLFVSVFTFPPTIAAIFGIVFRFVGVPAFLKEIAQFMSQAAIPLTLVALGMSLKNLGNFNYLKHLISSVTLKLIISPLLASLIVPWFLSGLAAKVTITQAAMPALMLTYILSVRYETEPEFASYLVFFSTLVSMITIPLVTYFLAS